MVTQEAVPRGRSERVDGDGNPKFRARADVLKHRLLNLGYEATTRGLAEATGLTMATARRALQGHPLSAYSVLRLSEVLGQDGERAAALFETLPPSIPHLGGSRRRHGR
jgi:hypothetical protein